MGIREDHNPDRLFGGNFKSFAQTARASNNPSYVIDRLINYEENLRYNLQKFKEEDYSKISKVAEKQAEEKTIVNSVATIQKHLQQALDVNKEYDHPLFSERLFRATTDPRIISFVNGKFRYQFELVAGRAGDWLHAVREARNKIGMGYSKEPARSYMWMEKFYKPAREGIPYEKTNKKTGVTRDLTNGQIQKYWRTIEVRLQNMQSLAPFWYFLNYGNVGGWGKGTPYPNKDKTSFVSNAEKELNQKFREIKTEELRILKQEYNGIIQSYTARINEVRLLIQKLRNSPGKVDEQSLNKVKKSLGDEKFTRADREKLEALALKLERGEQIPERTRLGGGVRVRTIDLLKQFRGK